MTRGPVPSAAFFGRRLLVACCLLFAAVTVAWAAGGAAPAQPTGNESDFGQYVAAHQSELGPVFSRNASDIFKLAVPLIMGMTGWVVLLTMLVGWGLDVLLSRGYAFLFAPGAATIKKSVFYATGQLVLTFIYTFLMALAVVLCLGFSHAAYFIFTAVMLLGVVSFAAQVVWILYIYHTRFGISILFYVVVTLVHTIAFVLLAEPFFGARAPGAVAQFIDTVITPKLRDETQATNHALASMRQELASAQVKTNEMEARLSQAESEKQRLSQQIDDKKNSDIYALAQTLKLRARGDLTTAREQLVAFPAKYPSSPLNGLVRTQISEIDSQVAAQTAEQKQAEADAAHAAAVARQELLAHAAKGQATLSEMRAALLGKSRDEVKDLLGAPTETGADTWSYRQQMILDPVTGQHGGMIVNFFVGKVQSVESVKSVEAKRDGGTL